MSRTKKSMTSTTIRQKKRLPRSIHIFSWSFITAALIAFGLPLLYEVYLSFTPHLESHVEQKTYYIAQQSAYIFGATILVLGFLLALKRWRWERKRARLKKMIRQYRLQQRQRQLSNR